MPLVASFGRTISCIRKQNQLDKYLRSNYSHINTPPTQSSALKRRTRMMSNTLIVGLLLLSVVFSEIIQPTVINQPGITIQGSNQCYSNGQLSFFAQNDFRVGVGYNLISQNYGYNEMPYFVKVCQSMFSQSKYIFYFTINGSLTKAQATWDNQKGLTITSYTPVSNT